MNINRFVFCLLVVCLAKTAVAQSPRQHINFDDNWKFHFGHAANPEKDFNYSLSTIFSKSGGAWGTAIEPRFKDSAWRTLNLPHDWAVELPFVNVDNRDVESHGYKPVGGLFPKQVSAGIANIL
jgi:beta-galactosidase